MNRNFRAFTLKSNGILNRIISDLDLSVVFDPANPPAPMPVRQKVSALWDTGATSSVISASTANALGLVPSGTVRTTHAGGISIVSTYVVNMFLPNMVLIPGVNVSEFVDSSGQFGAIIGMDVISRGDFSITNANGKTCMSFRFPSIKEIDYVKEANLINYSGVRRNDPCPCGKTNQKGKPVKFKYCHGKNMRD